MPQSRRYHRVTTAAPGRPHPRLAVADAVSLLNPRVVAVGGQLAGTEEHLFAGMREIIYRRSLPWPPVTSRSSEPTRPAAGLLGLSLLLSEEIFSLERIGALATG